MLQIPDSPEAYPALKAWTQLVNLPLQAFVIFTVCWLAAHATRRERIMLGWFIVGLAFGLLQRVLVLLHDGEPEWAVTIEDGLLPALTSLCFLVSVSLWWRGRGKP